MKGKVEWRLAGLNFLFFSVAWSFFLYLPVYYKSVGINDTLIGLLVSFVPLSSLLFSFPFGVLSDVVSPRLLIRAGAFFLLGFSGLFVFQRQLSFGVLAPIMVLFGIAYIIFNVVLTGYYLKHLSAAVEQHRARYISVFYLALYLGFAMGILVSGYVISNYDFAMLFKIIFGQSIVIFGLTIFLPEERPISFHLREYVSDIKRRDVLMFVLIMLSYGFHTGTEQTSFALFSKAIVHITQWQVGQIFFVIGLWLGTVNLLGGRLLDRQKDRIIVIACIALVISGVFQYATIYARSFWGLLGLRLLHTVGDSLIYLARAVFIALLFPRRRVGGNFGFSFFVQAVGMTLGASLSGYMQGRYSYAAPFAISGILNIAVVFGILALYLWPKKAQRN